MQRPQTALGQTQPHLKLEGREPFPMSLWLAPQMPAALPPSNVCQPPSAQSASRQVTLDLMSVDSCKHGADACRRD